MLSPVSPHWDTRPHAQIPLGQSPRRTFDCRLYLIMGSQKPHQSSFQVVSHQGCALIPVEMG